MQTVTDSKKIEGIFIKELKNRFLCEVLINNKVTVCYVPSSCHLSHFVELTGKKVILRKTCSTGARTQYALAAVPYKRNYIVLNTSAANTAFENTILSRKFCYLGPRENYKREHSIYDYKCDFYLPTSHTIIEIKSVLSLQRCALFPTVYSERTITQLVRLLSLLQEGYKAFFYIVSLHPYVNEVYIQQDCDFYALLQECISAGLIVKACTLRTIGTSCYIDKHIPVVIE